MISCSKVVHLKNLRPRAATSHRIRCAYLLCLKWRCQINVTAKIIHMPSARTAMGKGRRSMEMITWLQSTQFQPKTSSACDPYLVESLYNQKYNCCRCAGTSLRMTGGHGSNLMSTIITRWQLFLHSLDVACHSLGHHKSLQRRLYSPCRRTLEDEPRCYCDTRREVLLTTPLNKEVLIKGLTN